MGVGDRLLQKLQDEQHELDERHLDCALCGVTTRVRWYGYYKRQWRPWKSVYEGSRKKLLCAGCAAMASPSAAATWRSLSPLQREAVRGNCVTKDGRVNPLADHSMFCFMSNFYPCYWLGDKTVTGIVTVVTRIRDSNILTFIPDAGQDYMMDEHVKQHGCLYTSLPLWYHIDLSLYPSRVQMHRWRDEYGFMRTHIVKR